MKKKIEIRLKTDYFNRKRKDNFIAKEFAVLIQKGLKLPIYMFQL